MDADPLSEETLQLIIKALMDNNILQTLFFPSHSIGSFAVKEIKSLTALEKLLMRREVNEGVTKFWEFLFLIITGFVLFMLQLYIVFAHQYFYLCK